MRSIIWTNEEIEKLINLFPNNTIQYCANTLGRSRRACSEKAKKLNLKKYVIYEDENSFTNLIKSSISYTECLNKLNLSTRCSGNFQTLKKYIKLYSINIDHFRNGFGYYQPNKAVLLENVLTKDSLYSRKSLKSRLYSEGLKEKKCEICGMDENWFNGLKIVHILDHINGDPYDNRIENLRIVCPNCNSTLDTSTGKNRVVKSKEKVCEICGKSVSRGCNKCRLCNGMDRRKVERPNYETLKKEVGELGYKGTGKKYGVADNTIKKWLILYENELNSKYYMKVN